MEVGGKLLGATFDTYYHEETTKLYKELDLYSISVYGDGVIIKTTHLNQCLDVLPRESSMCTGFDRLCSPHANEGRRKDARFVATEMLKAICNLDHIKNGSATQIMFDGASNIQKASTIIPQHIPCAIVDHGAEHVVSLIVEKLMAMPVSVNLENYERWQVIFCFVTVLL